LMGRAQGCNTVQRPVTPMAVGVPLTGVNEEAIRWM
jgi:hypothetical protein